jgi:hypothetical protein
MREREKGGREGGREGQRETNGAFPGLGTGVIIKRKELAADASLEEVEV